MIQHVCDRCDGLLDGPGFLPVDQETGVAPGKTVRFSVWADIKAINEKGETFRPDLCNRCVAVLVERAATRLIAALRAAQVRTSQASPEGE